MEKKTVAFTARAGLCASCGVCKNVCPKACISYEREGGMFVPHVDAETCIRCGLCASACPGLSAAQPAGGDLYEAMFGTIRASCNAWSRDSKLRHVSASGGVVMSLVSALLKSGAYDLAFTLDTYNYDEQLKTEPITAEDLPEDWENCSFPKSRYLPVSHENAVRFLRDDPDRRAIFVGSPCALRGLEKTIQVLHRDREQYLFLGLFCDGVFNYNVFDYYQRNFGGEKRLTALHFKNKDSGGWPGNMKLFYSDGSTEFRDKKERAKLKDYFMPERCLYCADKLNVGADISIGDNYTEFDSSPLGSNSVLIRTERGQKAWDSASALLESRAFPPEALEKAQYLSGRAKRFYYALLKQSRIEKKTGERLALCDEARLKEDPREYERALYYDRQKAESGGAFREEPAKLEKLLAECAGKKQSNAAKKFAERVYFAIKRRTR